MIVSKESIRDVAELVTLHILSCSTERGHSEIDLEDHDIVIEFDTKVDNARHFASVKLSHKGVDLGTVQISDLDIMTSNVWANEKKQRWIVKTNEYLYRQLTKYLVKKFITEDSAMIDVKSRLEASGDTVKWSVGPLCFSGCHSKEKAMIKCKLNSGGVLYENIKTNHIGMTTEMGYQGLNVSNILGDFGRILVAALAQESVTFPVAV